VRIFTLACHQLFKKSGQDFDVKFDSDRLEIGFTSPEGRWTCQVRGLIGWNACNHQLFMIIERSAEFWLAEEECYVTELVNDERDSEVSVAKIRVFPGKGTQWHVLSGCEERYIILKGRGRLHLRHPDKEPVCVEVDPTKSVLIPRGVAQRIDNCGDAELEFLVICTPRFKMEYFSVLKSN